MTTVVLVQALPRIASTGEAVAVRLAGGGSRPYDQLGFSDWRSGVATLPRFTSALGFDQMGFTGGALPQTGGVRFFPSDRALLTYLSNLNWIGARIVIVTGDDEAATPIYAQTFVGEVADMKSARGAITLTLSDLSGDLDKPVCSDTFAGTGGLEGGDDATGRIKRRTWGYAFNIEGKLLDKANSIYEFGDPAQQLSAFPMVKDKGREAGAYVDVAWQGTAAATLTKLIATTVPGGGCARAPSIACVKWWTTPAGPLTADVQGEIGTGYVSTAPEIAARVVGLFSTQITVGNTAEALTWQSAVAGVHVDESSETVGNMLDRLLLPVSTAWLLGGDGVLSFRRIYWGAAVDTVTADTIEREATFQPLKTRRVGFQRNHRLHSDAEISAALLLATDATYADGTPIEILKPATTNATAGAPIGTTVGGTIVNGVVVGGVPAVMVADETLRAPQTRVDVVTLQAVDRQYSRDRSLLEQTLIRAVSEASRTRAILRDAGITVDPTTGVVRIYGVDQIANRTSNVEIKLDAQASTITQKASVDYVDMRIAQAAIPGQADALTMIYSRLTSAESNINGALAQVALKADAVTVTNLTGTVNSVSQTLDALAGVVATKASSTVVDGLSTRIGAAELTLQSFGNVSGITIDLRQTRARAVNADAAALQALLAGDAADKRQIVQLATVKQEIYARTDDGDRAEAALRLQLAARVGASEAGLISEQLVRADQFSSVSSSLTGVTSRVGSAESSVSFLLRAVNGQEAIAKLALTADGVVTGFVLNGQTRTFTVQAERFLIEGVKPFSYDSNTGTLRLPNIEVDRIKAGSIDTPQLASNAVTNFRSGDVGISSTDAGSQQDSEQRVTITTSGGRVRMEVIADTLRTGSGTNAGSIAIVVFTGPTTSGPVGRAVKCQAAVDGPPVYYATYVNLPAGTYTVGLRLMVASGKGTNSWTVPTATIGLEETKA